MEAVGGGLAVMADGLEKIIDDISAADVKLGRWIPVGEALPKGSDGRSLCENVIACTVEGEVCTGWLKGDRWYLLLGRDTEHTRHGRGYVTHWMPLPERPGGRIAAEPSAPRDDEREIERLKAEVERIHRENFWLTGGGIGRAGLGTTPAEVRGDE